MPWPIPAFPDGPPPAPLTWYRWALLLAGLLLAGVVLVLFNWPASQSTQTPDFWLLMFGAPSVAFMLALGLRLTVLENGHIRQEVWGEWRHGLREAWTQWSQRHHVATHAVVLAPVASDLRAWFDPDTPLPVNLGRSLSLKWTEALTAEQWVDTLLARVAEAMAPSLRTLRGALTVQVMLDAATGQALGPAWEGGTRLAAALAGHGIDSPLTLHVQTEPSLHEWNAWVDRPFETPVLLIAAQRAADPDAPAFSEGAMAMLFAATNARPPKTASGVCVYRPMACTADTLASDLAEVRRVQGPNATHIWPTGVEARMQGGWLVQEADDADAPIWRGQKMDEVFGLPGPLSAWIALGMAVQAAALLRRGQLVIAGAGNDAAILCMAAAQDKS